MRSLALTRDLGDNRPLRPVRSRLREVAVAVAIALGLVVIGFAWVVGEGRTSASASTTSGVVQTVAADTDPGVVVSISPLLSPENLVEPPSAASDPAKPARRWAAPTRPLVSPASRQSWTRTTAHTPQPPRSRDVVLSIPSGTHEVTSSPPSSPMPPGVPSPEVPPADSPTPLLPTPTWSTAAPTTPRVVCQPPYVVDPQTGKKEWKLECL